MTVYVLLIILLMVYLSLCTSVYLYERKEYKKKTSKNKLIKTQPPKFFL
jgi:hypothetical protein